MKYLSTIFLFLVCRFSQSQIYFNKVIPSSEYFVESASSQVLELDSNLLGFILHSSYRNKPGQENKICKINANGELNNHSTFVDSVNYEIVFNVVNKNDKYYLCGLKNNSTDNIKEYWISRADKNLNLFWTKKFKGIYNHCVIRDVFVENENKIICAAADINVRTNGTWLNGRAVIFALDSLGNILFYNTIQGTDTVSLDSYEDVIGGGDTNIYSCGYAYKRNLDQEPLIVKLSPDGNLTWRKQIVEPKYNEVLLDIFYQRDGTLLCIGDSYDGTNSGKEFSYILLMNIDTSGFVKWTKRIIKGYLNESYECIQDQNGNLICGGRYKASQNYIKDGWIVKFTNTGDSLWSRVINHDDSTSEGFFHISQASDGGYYLTGYSWVPGDNSSKAWIVKTDSFGCVVPGCEKVVSVEDIKNGKEKAFVFFPNPVHERFFFLSRISSSQKHYLMIYNLQGQLMQTYPFTPYEGHQNQVDVNQNISSGEYLMQIHDQEGNIVAWEKMIIQ